MKTEKYHLKAESKFTRFEFISEDMKTIKDISNQSIPLVAIDKSLDKLRGKVMFPKKLEKANKVLSTAKLPEKRHHS